MQSAITTTLSSSSSYPRRSFFLIININPPKLLLPASTKCRSASIRSNALSVNYSSTTSVFPAEACETIGGDACLGDICPEVKLEPAGPNYKKIASSEPVDREYFDYTQLSRTVLLGEACDVLGGDFCEPPYQNGIFKPQESR